MKTVLSYVKLVPLLGILLWLPGCEQTNPIEPVSSVTLPKLIQDEQVVFDDPTSMPAANLEFITLPYAKEGIVPSATRSKGSYVSRKRGGEVTLDYTYKCESGRVVSVRAVLHVPPRALDADTYIWMTIADGRLDFNFGPNGLSFNVPATLDVNVSGLSPANLMNGQKASFNWYDPDQESWVKMPAGSIRTRLSRGSFSCNAAQVPHFSRYGFGR